MKMKRGRPKASSKDHRSFGPLGDLIRNRRMERGLGLSEVAKACECSVQFISNIEHGRAPLPWGKTELLASVLGLPLDDLRSANLAIRADFKGFMGNIKGSKVPKPQILSRLSGTASAVSFVARDTQLQEIILKYQSAPQASRKKFVKEALEMLAE